MYYCTWTFLNCRIQYGCKITLSDVEEPKENDNEDLWDEWNPTQDELQKMDNTVAMNKNPIKIESGGKVFFINKIEHFHP